MLSQGTRGASSNVRITPRNGGKDGWAVKTDGASRADSIHPTQRAADQRGHEMLSNRGGGELTIHNRDGVIRSKDTIGRTDPNPPRDTEH